ncbi:hypothetical protein LPJ57_006558 [Coemansia sp. RSA 486]|nr:hypothetical protein LPJ57_006558 [Coemansia sp. RSA 486]KAJ2602305.1 hypothetical protein GGF39_000795 [Coemansia sp. RSA 1721]KAJ2640465.1 hypothetical protein GGF40_000113 [Coemansia sp. RSA 1286]
MTRLGTAIIALAWYVVTADAQDCSGNAAICPNGQDGVSQTYLQCDSWAGKYVSASCPDGQVCYANPNIKDVIMCAPPGVGGVPSAGQCTEASTKCADSGKSADYFSCEPWSGQYVSGACPSGLTCYDRKNTPGVIDCL